MRSSSATDRPSSGAPASTSTAELLVPVSSTPRIRKCRLLRRYKRFLADVVFPEDEHDENGDGDGADGGGGGGERFVTVHCPNTGPMTGLLDRCPDAEAWVSVADDPLGRRKYQHTLEAIRPVAGGPLVGVHSAAANKVVRALLEAGVLSDGGGGGGGAGGEEGHGGEGVALLPRLRAGDGSIAAEVSYGGKRKKGASSSAAAVSRADFLLQCGDELGGELVLEVKSVTLAEDALAPPPSPPSPPPPSPPSPPSRLALFPDTVSLRAQRHARDLEEVVRGSSSAPARGRRAAIVFLIQRADCAAFSPSEACDPGYCRALRSAARAGVLVLAVRGEIVACEKRGMLFRYLGRARVELGEDKEEAEEEEQGGGAKKGSSDRKKRKS